MDAFQRRYPHLKWSWPRRKWFLLRLDVALAISYWRTRWYCWKHGQKMP